METSALRIDFLLLVMRVLFMGCRRIVSCSDVQVKRPILNESESEESLRLCYHACLCEADSNHEDETMKRTLKPLLMFTLSLNLCAISSFTSPTARSQQSNQTVALAGLHDRVTIRRDERGIPYIEATNDEDLYFAQGYVTASDRLWQMDLQRRSARGELSEILGQAALGEDKRQRAFGFAHVLDETTAHLPADLKLSLEAYARG